MQVNYAMKLKLSADYIGLDRLLGQVRAACPEDIEVAAFHPPTEARRIPDWTALHFSRQFGSPDALEALVNERIARAGLADRLEPA